MLAKNPEDRITAEEALSSEWMTDTPDQAQLQ
jgi:serine/threonine protein kinase